MYIAPMRRSILWLAHQRRPWDLEALSNLAGANIRRAMAYTSVLVALRVIDCQAPLYDRGPKFTDWVASEPRSRPGGFSTQYLARKHVADMDPVDAAAARRDFGRRMREYRVRLELLQREMADRVGISRETLVRLERGQKYLGQDTMDRIVNVLGMEDDDGRSPES